MANDSLLTLTKQFDLNLPTDIIAWCDGEIWKEESYLGFGEPLRPDEVDGAIWGGQMLPDTLPFIGDGSGDCLCLRIQTDGSVSEVVSWLHEGGLWSHLGNTLPEALLFDATCQLAKDPALEVSDNSGDGLVFANWALNQLDDRSKRERLEQRLTLDNLLASNVAELAVRRELCRACWTSGLLASCYKLGGRGLAQEVGVAWPEFSKWMFDVGLVPEEFQSNLARAAGIPVEELLRQNWAGAVREAEWVSKARPDFAWPYNVMGWVAERQGLLDVAVDHYCHGLKKLQTSADFTSNWGMTDRFLQHKFAIERLNALQQKQPSAVRDDAYLSAGLASFKPKELHWGIRGYCLDRAMEAESKGFHDRAYWFYYNAGWDIYYTDEMPVILAGLARAAHLAGWPALARLAEVHHQGAARIA